MRFQCDVNWRSEFSEELWNRLASAGNLVENDEETPWINLGPVFPEGYPPASMPFLDGYVRKDIANNQMQFGIRRFPGRDLDEKIEIPADDLEISRKLGGVRGLVILIKDVISKLGPATANLRVILNSPQVDNEECHFLKDAGLAVASYCVELGEACSTRGLLLDITNGADGLRKFGVFLDGPDSEGKQNYSLIIEARTTFEITDDGEIPACGRLIEAVIGKVFRRKN